MRFPWKSQCTGPAQGGQLQSVKSPHFKETCQEQGQRGRCDAGCHTASSTMRVVSAGRFSRKHLTSPGLRALWLARGVPTAAHQKMAFTGPRGTKT